MKEIPLKIIVMYYKFNFRWGVFFMNLCALISFLSLCHLFRSLPLSLSIYCTSFPFFLALASPLQPKHTHIYIYLSRQRKSITRPSYFSLLHVLTSLGFAWTLAAPPNKLYHVRACKRGFHQAAVHFLFRESKSRRCGAGGRRSLYSLLALRGQSRTRAYASCLSCTSFQKLGREMEAQHA